MVMAPREAVEARPRRTVEILDDAWRIYFADLSFLLALTFLFYLPASIGLILLMVDPTPEWLPSPWLLPAITAMLIPLTGLSAGACQEAFYSWAEGYDVGFGECIKAACQRGLCHLASQALSLAGPVAILAFWFIPDLPRTFRIFCVVSFCLWTVMMSLLGLSRQPSFAAGKPRFWRAVRYGLRVARQDVGGGLLLLTARGVLLVFAVFNLHLLGRFVLWAAEHLGGFDVAYVSVICSLENGAYVLVLTLAAWCLLSPFAEAGNYLFFMDVRTRVEGLDLWNRVEDLFPAAQRAKAGMILLAIGAGLLAAGPVAGQEPLATMPSKEYIKNLVPPEKRVSDKRKTLRADVPKDKPKEKRPADGGDNPGGGAGKPVGPGLVGPTAVGGAANVLLVFLVGLGVAVLAACVAYLIYVWWQDRAKSKPRQAGALNSGAEDILEDPDKQDPAQLWRQADERARAGDHLGAVRTLYLAVLALMHQAGFIRYQRTRTNGEYVDQLRSRIQLQQSFRGLTGLFELKWYGQRVCESDDYRRCRELAEEIRVGSVVS
jgi:hypothetical protein